MVLRPFPKLEFKPSLLRAGKGASIGVALFLFGYHDRVASASSANSGEGMMRFSTVRFGLLPVPWTGG